MLECFFCVWFYAQVHFASGNGIARMPLGGLMVTAPSLEDVATVRGDGSVLSPGTVHRDVTVIGAFDTNRYIHNARIKKISGFSFFGIIKKWFGLGFRNEKLFIFWFSEWTNCRVFRF